MVFPTLIFRSVSRLLSLTMNRISSNCGNRAWLWIHHWRFSSCCSCSQYTMTANFIFFIWETIWNLLVLATYIFCNFREITRAKQEKSLIIGFSHTDFPFRFSQWKLTVNRKLVNLWQQSMTLNSLLTFTQWTNL